jgi:hypothetical protein
MNAVISSGSISCVRRVQQEIAQLIALDACPFGAHALFHGDAGSQLIAAEIGYAGATHAA